MSSQRHMLDISTISMEYMECTICVQIPRGNIYQCSNGHHICEECSKKVALCPICRSDGTRQRIPFAEGLLDQVKFPCSYNEQGCEETMFRDQLAAHEDQCDKNPDGIKLCSMFPQGENCQFKFTSKWLSEPGHCTEFINHVSTSHDYFCREYNLRNRQKYDFVLDFQSLLSEKPTLGEPLYHYFNPMFYRLPSVNLGAEQVIFLISLLKVDTLGDELVSFAFVRLTPLEETTPTVVKFEINGKPSSIMISNWGQNSFPPQYWTQNVICLNKFKKMVEMSTENLEMQVPLPFSFPVSFLSKYYEDEDKMVKVYFSFE